MSSIREGEEVYFSGYHPMLAGGDARVTCSMSDPGVHALLSTIVRETEAAIDPDGYHLNYSEIRTGGWEPDQVAEYENTGELLAAHIAKATNLVDMLTGHKPISVWDDMFNPHHNAVEDYFHVNNTLEGSWLGLPTSVRLLTWSSWTWGSEGRASIRRASLRFFEERGHEQIIAGYSDEDVIENYRSWMAAADGVSNVTGVIYATWAEYPTAIRERDLELFAKTWWGGIAHQLIGGRLRAGDFIQAEHAACRLVFEADGNLVAYASSEAYWNAGTQGAARDGWAEMRADGNFVVYDAAGAAQWSTGTGGNPSARVVIEDDCNVVVRAPGGAQLWATGRPFPLGGVTTGDAVRAVHLNELRSGVDAARRQCGLPNVFWIDPVIVAGVTPIKGVHITEPRAALDAAYRACGRMPPSWTDPEVISGVTSVKAAHFGELRDAVQELNGTARNEAPEAERTIAPARH